MAALRVVFEDERAVIATARNVVFVGWRGAPQVGHIREWERTGRALAKVHPGNTACVDIIVRGTPSFAEDMRREAIRLAADPHVFGLGYAHIILLPGMAGAAVRAFVGTVLLVARPPVPAKVFGDIPRATDWMMPRLAEHGWTQKSLSAASAELVERLG